MSGRMFIMPVRNRCLSCLLTSVFVTSAVLHGILFFHFQNLSISVSDITYFWQTEPIISVYVPSEYQGNICSTGYEPVSLDYMAIQALSSGPCGCAQNTMSYNSTTTECPADWKESEACMSLSPMPGITSTSWRGSTICILRGGKPAATYLDHSYWSRPQPDSSGQCPTGYQKCGAGDSQDSGAICFPVSSLCPITSMIVLPRESLASDSEDWESVGVFPSSNHTLYVRREQPNELPIVDIVARLTELTPLGKNLRGQCHEGNSQTLDAPLISDPAQLWTYTTDMLPVCETVDSRYLAFDAVDLQGHFLENLQLTQPTCALFDLYPTYDTRYNVSTDPDYLSSGVQCDFTSQYPCVSDPYQRTNCAAGDNICEGVVNQNICGEYVHAVRSALTNFSSPNSANHTNRITLGLYYVREIQWSTECAVDKESIFTIGRRLPFLVVLLLVAWLVWTVPMLCCKRDSGVYWKGKHDCHVLFPMLACLPAACVLPVALARIIQWRNIYSAIGTTGDCTDAITTDILLDLFVSLVQLQDMMIATIVLTWFFAVCGYIGMTCCPVEDPADRVDSADDTGNVANAIERRRIGMYLRFAYTSRATYHNGSARAPPIATVQATPAASTVTPAQTNSPAQQQRAYRPVSSRSPYTPPAAPPVSPSAPDPLRPAHLPSPQASNKPPPPARSVRSQSPSDGSGYAVSLNDYL